MIEPVFKILAVEKGESAFHVSLSINGHSNIFDGHFPGQPVVPGACMLQLVKDVLAEHLSLKLKLLKADNIKFLGLVQPGNDQLGLQVNYQIIDDQIKVTATLSTTESISMKLQGTFATV